MALHSVVCILRIGRGFRLEGPASDSQYSLERNIADKLEKVS